MERYVINGLNVTLKEGDITQEKVDAIVNAANTELLPGGGVCGAIHRAGGPTIAAACRAWVAQQGICPTGRAVATPAGDLSARYVIHAVGPVYSDYTPEESDRLLASAYQSSLEVAGSLGLTSIAFPAVSTGIYGFPLERATEIAIETVHREAGNFGLMDIRFLLFGKFAFATYQMTILGFMKPGR